MVFPVLQRSRSVSISTSLLRSPVRPYYYLPPYILLTLLELSLQSIIPIRLRRSFWGSFRNKHWRIKQEQVFLFRLLVFWCWWHVRTIEVEVLESWNKIAPCPMWRLWPCMCPRIPCSPLFLPFKYSWCSYYLDDYRWEAFQVAPIPHYQGDKLLGWR